MSLQTNKQRGHRCACAVLLIAVASLLLGGGCAPAAPDGGATPTVGPGTEPPELDTSLMSAPFRDALERTRAAVISKPRLPQTWGDLGALLDAHLFYEQALICYERAHQLAPDDFRWLYLPAVVMDFLGSDLDSVDAAFQAALVNQPDYPPLRYRFAEALLRQGASDRALVSFRKAIELDPNFALAQRGLGQALLAQGQLDEAIAHLERARQIATTDSVTHAALARAYHLQGDAEASRTATERARSSQATLSVPDPVRYAVDQLSLEPAFLTRRVNEALSRKDFVSAERDLAILERIFPTEAMHPLRRGQCLRKLKRPQPARLSFQRALELEDPTGGAHSALADLLQEQGDLPAALVHRRDAANQQPARATYRNSLGLALAMSGDLNAALEEFATCASLAPPTSELHHNWGTTLLQQNRLEDAAQHFETALQLEPDSAGTLYNLGTIHERQGRNSDAIKLYKRAAAVDPTGPAADRLGKLGE
ncbi:MAG: tetratricopeptide (TPR) repeat protein [Chlamydiales bacterium]|jgi:tetratricopeptide (TPR) repeat protein